MTDIFTTLKTVLETTGKPVFYERLPVNSSPGTQWIRFQRISAHEFPNMTGRSNLHRDRFQVTCAATTHALLVALVALMETALYFNGIDFQVAYPLEGAREVNDGMETYMKDFYIWYSP